ncbi:hypothetical protein CALCODRAFT_486097 [Calocera cornea HHB12733]|uniref:WD40 repeat-like protein n=1 Tax=Calocera cornea HHB12733 TaxID=1353952 RepID=A0A165DX50_9BASI|nr:hypothetical protein CALCODRAFT_486097 [Calocera cornea HHB12733]
MELRRKERISYSSLFEAPSDEEPEADPNADPAAPAKAVGKARVHAPESSDESDVYQPEGDDAPLSDHALPSDAEPSEPDDGPPAEEDGDDSGASAGGPASRSAATRTGRRGKLPKIFQRMPSPPANAPKRVQLTRLAPAPPNKNQATHQAKYSSRLRATSLYFPPKAKRLAREPEPYGFDGWGEEVPTTSADRRGVLKRLIQAHARCEGGPRWELLEDRAWWRESTAQEDRPRVWEGLRIKSAGVTVLSLEEATPYLPSSAVLTETGASQPPPPLTCHFGLFDSQQKRTVPPLSSFPLKEHIPTSREHILNAGAPVHSLAWCPVHPSSQPAGRAMTHHLAVAPFLSSLDQPTIGQRSSLGSVKGCIQIWSFAPQGASCEMVLCTEEGPAWQLAWCPLPADDVEEKKGTVRKMGLLAGCFRSGHLSIYAVPHPDALRAHIAPKQKGKARAREGDVPGEKEILHVKLEPVARLEVDGAGCWRFDWANSGLIAAGCTNGKIAVFDVGSILKDPILRLPTHYFPVHQSCVHGIAWIRGPAQALDGTPQLQKNPVMIASGGYDGQMLLVDIRDGVSAQVERMRDWVTSVQFSTFSGGPIFVEQDYRIKHISLSSLNLGRGSTLMDALGPIWSIATSDYHSSVALASADGIVHLGSSGKAHNKGHPNLLFPLYQLDYNRKTGEYRMLDHLKPRESRQVEGFFEGNKKRLRAQTREVSEGGDGADASVPPPPEKSRTSLTHATGAWPPQVNIYCAAWCSGSGMARAPMLASGGASGLVRIDWVLGTWTKGVFPYKKIEVLRGEVDGVDDALQGQEGEEEEEDEEEDD